METPETSRPSGLVGQYLGSLAQGIGLFAGVAYVLGYIVVNVYLSRYGVVSKSALNLQYLSAGTTLILILAFLIATTGLRVYRMDEDGKIVFRAKPVWVSDRVWWMVTLICVLSGVAFAITFTAVTLTFVFFESATWLFAAIGIYFAIDYQLAFFGVYRRFPVPGLLFSTCLYLGAIWLAASRAGASSKDFRTVFWSVCALAFLVLMQLEFHRMFNASFLTKIVSASVIVLLLAIAYGRNMYETIPAGLGGGKPTLVKLLISGQNASVLRQIIHTEGLISDDVDLIDDNGEEVTVLVTQPDKTKRPVRLSKRLIDGILPQNLPLGAATSTPPGK